MATTEPSPWDAVVAILVLLHQQEGGSTEWIRLGCKSASPLVRLAVAEVVVPFLGG